MYSSNWITLYIIYNGEKKHQQCPVTNQLFSSDLLIKFFKSFSEYIWWSGKLIFSKISILLTTEKDYFRINESYRKDINFLKIVVEIQNRDQFIEEIKKIIWKLLNIFLNL